MLCDTGQVLCRPIKLSQDSNRGLLCNIYSFHGEYIYTGTRPGDKPHHSYKLKTMIMMIEMKQFSKRMVLNSTLTQIIVEDRRDLLLFVQVKEGRIVCIPAVHILICIIICYLLKITSKKVFFFLPQG